MTPLKKPQYLEPHIVQKIWGGERLAKLKNLKAAGKVGETWEISALSEGPSLINGKALDFPLNFVLKLIDTSDNLSVQVHPTDAYAKANGGGVGKTECWLVLDAAPGAGLYLGFEPGTTREAFFESVQKGEDLTRYLTFHRVGPGDFFWVPAGTVHAIGKNVFLAEVQQCSGVTYRVWDWNRTDDSGKPRPLHVKEAFDVLNFDPRFNAELLHMQSKNGTSTSKILARHPDFQVEMLVLRPETSAELKSLNGRPIGLLGLQGELEVVGTGILPPYKAMLLPEFGNWVLRPPYAREARVLVVR